MEYEEVARLFRRKRATEILHLLTSEGELNFSDLSDEIESSSDTISQTLDLLCDQGLVERRQNHTNDVRYRITGNGDTVLDNIEEIRSSIQDQDGP